MIVDDEPFFLQNSREIIEQSCKSIDQFITIVGECYSAESALQKIPELMPDLIFTDIRMNTMDGLELAQRIAEEWPYIKVVIVSGYPSFDSARIAIQAKVIDYLVKPIDAETISVVIGQALEHMKANQYQRKREIIRTLIKNRELSPNLLDSLQQMNNNHHYYVIGLQTNFLTFRSLVIDGQAQVQNDYFPHIRKLLYVEDELWFFPSTHTNSILLVVQVAAEHNERILRFTERIIEFHEEDNFYTTALISNPLQQLQSLSQVAMSMLNQLDCYGFIGKSQILSPSLIEQIQKKNYTFLNDIQRNTLSYLTQKQDWRGLQSLLKQWFIQWEIEQCPSTHMEMELRKLVDLISSYIMDKYSLSRRQLELHISNIIVEANSYLEISDSFYQWLRATLQPFPSNVESKGHHLFENMKTYINENLAQPLSIITLTERFQISSTYLCNLFRIHSSNSFLEYFTEQRMNKAKDILIKQPEIPIKDIAEFIGYTDRHYFSKVFKSNFEMTPSEYRLKYQQQ